MKNCDRRTFLWNSAKGLCLAALAHPFAGLWQTVPATHASDAFPADFYWGAATSAMQVEGSPYADGGGKSVWSSFQLQPGVIKDGSTNLVADDEYHHYPEDVATMRQMGLNAYRFSIAWPRVLPGGRGRANEKGLAYYDRLIDALLEAQITPFATLFHFDYPQPLQQRGGWLNPDSPQWVAEYAHLVASRYSDRVTHWLTINEPNILWGFGAEIGWMPPNLKLPEEDLVRGAHNLLLGHGRSVQAIRAAAKQPLKIGLPFAGQIALPASEKSEDVAAARSVSFSVQRRPIIPGLSPMAMLNTAWWLDPVFLGEYPEDGLKLFPSAAKRIKAQDMQIIRQPLDYCAVNLYFAPTVKAGPGGWPEVVPDPPSTPRTHYGWPLTPELLYWGPKFLAERYGKPVLITENGMSRADEPSPDGKVHDPERTQFLDSYLGAFKRACREGVPLAGYFHWSLLDNWEFSEGFGQRFGLVYVDLKTQKRIVKDSAGRYREIIQSHGRIL